MIRKTTVLKRMVQNTWKPLTFGVLTTAVVSALSVAGEVYMGLDYNTTYWSLLGLVFAGCFAKGAYDWTRTQIEFEQEKLLRDLGKKND